MTTAAHDIVDRARRNWRTKLWLGAVLGILFCAGYFGIQRLPLREPMRIAPSPVDDAIGFSPSWVWAYQSIYLLLPLAWLAPTRHDLRRYTVGFAWLMIAGFAFFLFLPVVGPRPVDAPAAGGGGMYLLLTRYDSPLNSFPSLHMALATYSAAVAISFTEGRVRRGLRVVLPIWIGLIAFSTLATKQHYLVDLPPGILLGWLAHRFAWRRDALAARASAMPSVEGGPA
jgi:membrane-associated phospholipid phosphatase